jgi:hypothetical protein
MTGRKAREAVQKFGWELVRDLARDAADEMVIIEEPLGCFRKRAIAGGGGHERPSRALEGAREACVVVSAKVQRSGSAERPVKARECARL